MELHNGDIVLTGRKHQGIVSSAIRLGSKLRYGQESPYVVWAHCSIVIDAEKFLVAEANKPGVQIRDMRERYPAGDFAVVPTGATMDPRDFEQVLAFVNAVVAARTKYGILTFVGLGLYCLTGGRLCIQRAGTAICSGLVCDALTRAGYIWDRPPFSMMPADIAHQLDFRPPAAA